VVVHLVASGRKPVATIALPAVPEDGFRSVEALASAAGLHARHGVNRRGRLVVALTRPLLLAVRLEDLADRAAMEKVYRALGLGAQIDAVPWSASVAECLHILCEGSAGELGYIAEGLLFGYPKWATLNLVHQFSS
jgi:hypothetical protein